MKIFKNIILNLSLFVFVVLPVVVSAQATTQPPPPSQTSINISIPNPTNAGSDVMSIIRAVLTNVIMPIAAVAVVFWIIWAGFNFITAQGNPAKIEVAKRRLLWSLIGAGVLLGAVGISAVVENTIRALLN